MVDEFLSQAQAEMRQEELKRVLRRFGGIGIAFLIVVLIGVCVWQWRLFQDHKAALAASSENFRAMGVFEAPLSEASADALKRSEDIFDELSRHAPGLTRGLAAMRLAQLRVHEHDLSGARAAWQRVMDDHEINPAFRSLAHLFLLYSHLDDHDTTETRRGLKAMASSEGPWCYLAQEGLIALDLKRDATAEETQEARRLLKTLASALDAPNGTHHRATSLLQSFDGVDK